MMLPNSFLFRYVRSAPADRCVLMALMRNNWPRPWRTILKKLICKIAQVRVLMDKFGWQEMDASMIGGGIAPSADHTGVRDACE